MTSFNVFSNANKFFAVILDYLVFVCARLKGQPSLNQNNLNTFAAFAKFGNFFQNQVQPPESKSAVVRLHQPSLITLVTYVFHHDLNFFEHLLCLCILCIAFTVFESF